jgi:hypothetical protein
MPPLQDKDDHVTTHMRDPAKPKIPPPSIFAKPFLLTHVDQPLSVWYEA